MKFSIVYFFLMMIAMINTIIRSKTPRTIVLFSGTVFLAEVLVELIVVLVDC